VATSDQLAYDDGWSALRAARFDDAATAFARTISEAPGGSLADDARFWHAVALARGHHSTVAILAFREAIDEHAGSSHAAEASAMLGWLLVEAKLLPEARARFAAAADDANDRVRTSARAGLDALAGAGH
ncbi:MAG: tetratricopeptide repeat protein, partial [Kofleriaceae bacterium]